MKKQRLPAILIGLLAFSLLGMAAGLGVIMLSGAPSTGETQSSVQTRRVLRENTLAPDFTLAVLDGSNVKLSDYKGRRVMLNFWASWCTPCLAETPDLVAAYNDLLKQGDNEIAFVGIGVNDDLENLRKFADNNHVPYVIAYDKTSLVADAYGVVAMPITVFVDEKGMVYRKLIGALKKQQVIDIFKEMKGSSQ